MRILWETLEILCKNAHRSEQRHWKRAKSEYIKQQHRRLNDELGKEQRNFCGIKECSGIENLKLAGKLYQSARDVKE